MSRKVMSILLVSAMLLILVAGCAAPTAAPTAAATVAPATMAPAATEAKTITIGFAVSNLANPFFVTMKDGGEAKAKELGVSIITLDAQDNNEKQASQIEDLISQKVDVLIINPVDSDAVVNSVKEANAAGIPVITVTRPSNGGEVVQHLDIDNKEAGKLDAEELVKELNGKGNVAILEGIAGTPSAQDRQKGFVDYLSAYPDVKVVASLTANYAREDGAKVMEDILQAHPDLNAVYAHNDEMALGAVRTIAAAGLTDKIKVFGVDATDDALAAIKAGQMAATVKQQPALQMGMAVQAAVDYLNGKTVEPIVLIPLVLVTKDTVSQ